MGFASLYPSYHPRLHQPGHCEERSDEAIPTASADAFLDCFAALEMTAYAGAPSLL
jgi:hypothetical protein